MIVLNILGYFGRNKQNSYAALKYFLKSLKHVKLRQLSYKYMLFRIT